VDTQDLLTGATTFSFACYSASGSANKADLHLRMAKTKQEAPFRLWHQPGDVTAIPIQTKGHTTTPF
jgi:hypothetical protein